MKNKYEKLLKNGCNYMNGKKHGTTMRLYLILNIYFLSSCVSENNYFLDYELSPVEGFELFQSARTFDAPGQIIRVSYDQELDPRDFDLGFGNWNRVTFVDVTVLSGIEQTLNIEKTKEFSINSIFNYLGIPASTLGLEIDNNNITNVDISTTNGIREYIQDDSGIYDKIEDYFQQNKPLQSNFYYLIRETIKTRDVKLSFNKSIENDLSSRIDLENIFNSNANIESSSNERYEIQSRFDEEMRIWYRAELILHPREIDEIYYPDEEPAWQVLTAQSVGTIRCGLTCQIFYRLPAELNNIFIDETSYFPIEIEGTDVSP